MNSRWFCTVLSLLVLAIGVQAQQPSTSPAQVSVGVKTDLGAKEFYKGWYLYWPADALSRPRMPMPFPYWPQQGGSAQTPQPTPNLSAPPGAGSGAPPGPLQLPRDNPALPSLPPLPGTSWGPGYYPTPPFQPVSYPVYAPMPGYWYYR